MKAFATVRLRPCSTPWRGGRKSSFWPAVPPRPKILYIFCHVCIFWSTKCHYFIQNEPRQNRAPVDTPPRLSAAYWWCSPFRKQLFLKILVRHPRRRLWMASQALVPSIPCRGRGFRLQPEQAPESPTRSSSKGPKPVVTRGGPIDLAGVNPPGGGGGGWGWSR